MFPVWIWKTFIHAKHEAFRFKYDSKSMQNLELTQMRGIGIAMYLFTIIYFCMMFIGPFFFVKGYECGEGINHWVYITYAVYGVITGIYEVVAVKRIEAVVDDEFLKFNRWHVVELFMGQIARLDTFLDACFLVMLIQCEMWNLVIPVSIFIFLMLSYPMVQLLLLLKVNKSL